MRRILAACSSAAVFVTASSAQTTHLVGPGGFAQINDAIAVAAPGDVILVDPGNYAGFQTTIGVTVRGTSPGVTVGGVTATLVGNQPLHLVNISSRASITGGRVTFDECTISGGCTAQSSEVHFQSCIVSGVLFFFAASPALQATDSTVSAIDSTVSAIDSTFTGPNGNPEAGFPAGEAVLLQNSRFHASHLVVRGGDNYLSSGPLAPKPALRAINSSIIWVSDSTLIGGAITFTGIPFVCPLVAQQARLARCTSLPNCTPPIPANGPLLGMQRPNALYSPGPFTLVFQGEPNGLVGVYFATGLGNLFVPGLQQRILLDTATTFHFELLAADGLGHAAQTWNIPAGLTNETFWFQAIGTASSFQLSPVAGGVVR